MKSREYYNRQLQSSKELQLVVKAMKASAGSAVQKFRQAAESLDQYEKSVDLGLKAWLNGQNRMILETKKQNVKSKAGILVFGSEQGMCGQFNQIITKYTVKKLGDVNKIEHFEYMFCAYGKSNCIDEKKGCICGNCPVHKEYNLHEFYYCVQTGGQ